MGILIERVWQPRYTGSGIPRSRQRSGTYRAYLPGRLEGRNFHFPAATAADVVDAERSVVRLDREARALGNMEALARILLRAESVASSKIEGLTVSGQRLLRAAVALAEDDQTNDETALEVLANVDAMSYVLSDAVDNISVDRLLAFHRRLLAPSALEEHGGKLRSEQNWIGGTVFNPFDAAFVPPPPEEVPSLLDDLCVFCNDDSLPAVAQAAIAHAQFETIHPFVDGNGRTGRALMHMILRRRGLITRTIPPVSLVLATRTQEYVNALQATRVDGPDDSPRALEAMNEWIGLFAASCTAAVEDAEEFERRIAGLQAEWKSRLGAVRSDAAALALIDSLPETPIVTTRAVERALGVSYTAANNAIAALVAAGVLHKTRAGRRNRAFEARELVDAFTDLERQAASVDRDTRISGPVRPVPAVPDRGSSP